MENNKNSKTQFIKKKEIVFVFCILPVVAFLAVVSGIAWMEFGDTDKEDIKVSIYEESVFEEDSEVPLYDKAIHETENYLPEKEVIEVPIENSDNMGGDLIFDEARITDEPIFYNYTTKNGVLIQLIFVKVPDGSLRVGVNLSRECKGEPDAYFEPGDGIFRCVNNGHVSAFGEIGIYASAPMGISYST